MCPVPRTTNGEAEAVPKDTTTANTTIDTISDIENDINIESSVTSTKVIDYQPTCCSLEGAPRVFNKKDFDKKVSYIEQYMLDQYDFNEETNAHQLSKVDCDVSLKLNRHLAANCRNISDEVFPGIHLGDRGAAKNTFYLKKSGVTHVLNTAEGTRVGLVDTNQNFYRPFGITYKGLKLLDVSQTNIAMYFSEVAEYIDEALKSGGKVLVNCLMGMSRSSTCVLAYLMLKQNMTAVEALTEVRRHREVRPNDGFLRQLADLDNKLRRERGQLKST